MMEELPEIRPNIPELSDLSEPVPEQVASPQPGLSYELDISPGNKATVEIEQMAEADFDRHEVIDETENKEPARNGMIPLGQVLQQHPARQTSAKTSPDPINQKNAVKTWLARPTYRRALRGGIAVGIVVSIVMIVAVIITNR